MKEILLRRKGLEGFTALVDDEDYEWLSQRRWYMNAGGYAWRSGWDREKKRPKPIFMHREILGEPEGLVVDHLDGDPMNNQRHNLRACTRSENSLNNPARRAVRGRWASLRDLSMAMGVSDYDALLRLRTGEVPSVNFGSRIMVPWSAVAHYEATRKPRGNPEWAKMEDGE